MSEITLPSSTPRRRSRSPRAGRAAGALCLALALGALGCGGDIEARMAEVRALQDVGQFTASIEELREILAIVPDLPEASYRLGVALVQTGEPSRAVWALEKAAESQEYAIPAALLLATAHFSGQNFEACVAAANRVLELDPDRTAALHMRANGHLGAGNLEAALEDAERLLEEQPDDYTINVLHATILADLGRFEESDVAHMRVKEMALESGDPAIGHRGCLAPALFVRDYMKDQARTEALFDDCVERFPTNGFVVTESMRYYDRIGKSEKATGLIRKAADEAPENLSLRSNLATRLRNQGNVEGAEQVLLEAVESFKSAGAWDLLANFYRQQDQPEKALEALEKVAELSGGGSDQLRFTTGDVLVDLGELDRAEEIAGGLQQPTYAKLLRGRIQLERGDPAAALALFDEGIRAWPDNAGARYLAGLAARELGDYDRAISELRESVRADASATPSAEILSRLYFERGNYVEAMRFGKTALKRRNANRGDLYAIGARALTELGTYDEARETAKSLAKLPDEKLRGTLELVRVERVAAGPAAARAAIDESGLDLMDPENEELLRAWVDAQVAEGQAATGLAKTEAALAAHPDHAGYHEIRGTLLLQLGRSEDADRAYQKAAELDPELASAWAGLGSLAAHGNDLAKAVEYFDKAAELAPQTSLYAYSAGQLAFASGDVAGAERRLREVVRRFPGHAGSRNDLAWILAEQGKELDYALELAEEAQRLDPSPDVLDTLGWVRLKRGEPSAAVAALEQAVEARADSPSIRYRLGLALSKSGNPDRAREMLQAAVAAGAFPEAQAARRELAQLDQP
ncbi:MAG: tetratricopeptide repeat protein [Myxococcota bacterium]|nr:tetratricopeptide repeat protein [Myxococcota bacterium]